MAIKKTESGWIVDVQPGGRGNKRYRKGFNTKREALEWETWLKGQLLQDPAWSPKQDKDARRLSELIILWWDHHGRELRAGEDTRSRLDNLAQAIGDPIAVTFTADTFATYRRERLDAGIKPNTVNREHAYLRSLFNELIRLGQWKRANPLSGVRQFKIVEAELTFLTLDQVRALLTKLECSRNPDVATVARIALATGARWGEAEGLRSSQLRHHGIEFSATKSGKNRTVPVEQSLLATLNRRATGRVRLFGDCYDAFRYAISESGLELPDGQLTHVLRHTFASHFMINGGNILALQRILGHSDLKMTMRYAHLAPEHLAEAVTLNPLARL